MIEANRLDYFFSWSWYRITFAFSSVTRPPPIISSSRGKNALTFSSVSTISIPIGSAGDLIFQNPLVRAARLRPPVAVRVLSARSPRTTVGAGNDRYPPIKIRKRTASSGRCISCFYFGNIARASMRPSHTAVRQQTNESSVFRPALN